MNDIMHTILKERAAGGLHSVPSLKWLLIMSILLAGCATSYTPKVTGPLPFAFTPTPEQCAQLLKERRAYRATEKTATYVSTATALLSVLFLGLVDEKAAPAASAGATLLASGVSVFAGSQVEGLEAELELGACLNRPLPALPSLAEGVAEQ
jgi:hypothetical protein